MGGALLALNKGPILAGILLGMLTYKPHFGFLFPLALLADRRWTTIISAVVTTLALTALSTVTFGGDTFPAFLNSLRAIAAAGLGFEPRKVHNAYGLLLTLGAPPMTAWAVQLTVAALCAFGVFKVWKSGVSFKTKAAWLMLASMVAAPQLMVYDFPILTIALAFLYAERRFELTEWIVVITANLLLAAVIVQMMPLGWLAVYLVAWVAMRRTTPYPLGPAERSASPRRYYRRP
jgi:hypothetical protein